MNRIGIIFAPPRSKRIGINELTFFQSTEWIFPFFTLYNVSDKVFIKCGMRGIITGHRSPPRQDNIPKIIPVPQFFSVCHTKCAYIAHNLESVRMIQRHLFRIICFRCIIRHICSKAIPPGLPDMEQNPVRRHHGCNFFQYFFIAGCRIGYDRYFFRPAGIPLCDFFGKCFMIPIPVRAGSSDPVAILKHIQFYWIGKRMVVLFIRNQIQEFQCKRTTFFVPCKKSKKGTETGIFTPHGKGIAPHGANHYRCFIEHDGRMKHHQRRPALAFIFQSAERGKQKGTFPNNIFQWNLNSKNAFFGRGTFPLINQRAAGILLKCDRQFIVCKKVFSIRQSLPGNNHTIPRLFRRIMRFVIGITVQLRFADLHMLHHTWFAPGKMQFR